MVNETVRLIVFCSPFAKNAVISIMLASSPIDSVVEKLPFLAGLTTSSESSVEISIVASGLVFPEMVIVFLENTASSFGESIVKKSDVSGVGEGLILIVMVFVSAFLSFFVD